MTNILLIFLGVTLAWWLFARLCQRKEYQLWRKISTRKDYVMDIVFVVVMGIVFVVVFYIFSDPWKTPSNPASVTQSQTTSPRPKRMQRPARQQRPATRARNLNRTRQRVPVHSRHR